MKKLLLLSTLCFSSIVAAQILLAILRPLTSNEITSTMNALCETQINLKTQTCLAKKSFYQQIERDPKSHLELSTQGLTGSFSKKGAKQIVGNASFFDADDLQERFVAGVSVLLEAGKVVRVAQDNGSSGCMVFARGDGRDGLVCEVTGFGQGYTETNLEWRDIGTGAKTVELMNLTSNSATCDATLKDFEITKRERRDINRDGKPDLVINLDYRTAPNPNCDLQVAKLPAKSYSLVFLWDGKNFKADAATSTLLKTWQ